MYVKMGAIAESSILSVKNRTQIHSTFISFISDNEEGYEAFESTFVIIITCSDT